MDIDARGAVRASTIVEDLRGQPRLPGLEVVLTAIVGFTAVSGGLTLAFSPMGDAAKLPLRLLEGTGFPSYLVPGMLLAFVIGGLNFVAAALTLRKSPNASLVSLLAGGGLVLFIVCELLLTRAFHPLQVVMGLMGITIAALSLPKRRQP